jgi:hypothetical protein
MPRRVHFDSMGSPASRLFHTVVVLGASAGCGGLEQDARRAALSDAQSADSPSLSEASLFATAPVDAAGPPTSPCDCARVGSFRCARCASGTTPVHGRCQANDGVDCFCDDTVAVADPGDCPSPAQFTCFLAPGSDASVVGYAPYSGDYYAFADCYCDPSRPVMPSQCDCEYCSLQCAMGSGCPFGSVAQNAFFVSPDASTEQVRYACGCLPPLPTIR